MERETDCRGARRLITQLEATLTHCTLQCHYDILAGIAQRTIKVKYYEFRFHNTKIQKSYDLSSREAYFGVKGCCNKSVIMTPKIRKK